MRVPAESLSSKRKRLVSTLAALTVAASVTASTGCSSPRMASLNPYGGTSTVAQSQGGWLSGPKKVGSSIVGGTKNAVTKSTNMVAGWFGKSGPSAVITKSDVVHPEADDPVSLSTKAEVTPEVFLANGRLWESTGNYEKAMESYKKALEKRPDDPAALANIARLHFRQKNHVEAAQYFGKAIEKKPEDAGLHNDLGLTLSKLGNHTAATAAITRALALEPNSSRYANNLASVKFDAGDSKGALAVLVKNNKPAVAHFNMAYLHYKHSQPSEAQRHLNQALTYAPQAETDVATKRAVDRAQELLAQIGGEQRFAAGTAIAQTPAPQTPATPVAATARVAPGGVQQVGSGQPSQGFQTQVKPASAAATTANFGTASFKTNTTPAVTAPSAGAASSAAEKPTISLPPAMTP